MDPIGADTERRLTADTDTDPELDAALQQSMHTSPQFRWAARQGMWSFGVGTPRAYLAASLAYHLRDGIAEKITLPGVRRPRRARRVLPRPAGGTDARP